MQEAAHEAAQPSVAVLPLKWNQPTLLFAGAVTAALIIGALLGALVSTALQPKPVNLHPLQTTTTNLQEQTRYERAMTLNYTLLAAHYNQLVNDLNANNVSASEADATLLASSTSTYINDLHKVTVPICLQATNTTLLQALTNIQQGASMMDKALVANDGGLSSQAGRQISQGLDQLTTAEQEYAAAIC